jgi:hypothetical protein
MSVSQGEEDKMFIAKGYVSGIESLVRSFVMLVIKVAIDLCLFGQRVSISSSGRSLGTGVS